MPGRFISWPFACISAGMRLPSSIGATNFATELPPSRISSPALVFLAAVVATSACTLGCAGTGASYAVLPPPPPPPVSASVTITPGRAAVVLGATQTFVATVTNSSDASVTWSVNGIAGGSARVGTISAAGVFTAPPDLPASTDAQITATSVADVSKSATATAIITSDIALGLTPATAGVLLGATQPFHVTLSSSGHPDSAVRWSISGAACPAACGTLDANGNYTAPAILPNPASVTITAYSVADPSKQISAGIMIESNFSLQLSAPGILGPKGSAVVAATLTPAPGSSPSTVLSWSLTGSGCSGETCGVLAVVNTQALRGGAVSTATYTAPVIPPNPDVVTIAVTPQADPSKKAKAAVTIQSGVGVNLSPGVVTLASLHRVTLTAQVFGSSNNAVTWSVNGAANGNGTFGQICMVASNPCQPLDGSNNLQVDYQAPGAIPTPNPVTVQAISVADSTRNASAQITVLNHVVVTVLPSTVTLAPLAVQTFAATVLGTSNQTVVWQVQGTACSGEASCGSIDANGTYTAPGAAPSPNAVRVVAISADDSAQSGAANVTIATGANILALHPASVYAGGADGFALRVDGGNFVGSTPGPGSVLMIGGTARTTTCTSVSECTVPVTPADVAAVGSVAVQIRNPDATTSNSVSLIVAAQNAADEVISLTSAAPTASAKDIVVVEPTTAGTSSPGNDLDLNVGALGLFSIANNSCFLGGNPVVLRRPESGIATADLCAFSVGGLDTSMTYTITGPGDLTVIAKQPLGLGIIHLILQISATAIPGARTLLIQNANLDKTAASGALEVQ
jgi:hypothetical protein